MALRRFFVQSQDLREEGVHIQGDLFHHIRDVCRFREGDQFEVLPGDQSAWLVEIQQISQRDLFAKRLSTRVLPAPRRPQVTLALSLPKLPKVDWIVEKCVELGVAEIRPFVSDYSFLRKTSEISQPRIGRWQKLVTAATQQAGRGDTMEIHNVVTLQELLNQFNQSPGVGGLFPYEGEARMGLRQALRELNTPDLDRLWIFVGSEGGFSTREVALFQAKGLNPVNIGDQILRVETACVALVSVIKYESGALG